MSNTITDRRLMIKAVAKQITDGQSYIPFEDDYGFENVIVNRKRGLTSKCELRLIKTVGHADNSDIARMYEFCYELQEVYVLDFEITFKCKDGFPAIVLKLSIGTPKNIEQMKIENPTVAAADTTMEISEDPLSKAAGDLVNSMQQVVNDPRGGIDKISISSPSVDDGKEFVIAERKQDEKGTN